MVMAPSPGQAVSQEAQAYSCALPGAAAVADPATGGRGNVWFWRGTGCRDVGGRAGDVDGGAVVCPCRQWSPDLPRPGTLVRHVMCVHTCSADGVTGRLALAPTTRALRMRDASVPGALVALCGLAPRLLTGLMPTLPAAVAVAAVAAAAQDDLDATTRAQVQAGGSVHAHPSTTEVLDGLVPARHTAVAPPSSARCRARYGRQASRQEGPLPRPPSSASTALYRGIPPAPLANADGVAPASRPMPSPQHSRPRLPGRPAGRPSRCTPLPSKNLRHS